MPGSINVPNGVAAEPEKTSSKTAVDHTGKTWDLATKETRDGLGNFSEALIGILAELWNRPLATQPPTNFNPNKARDEVETWNRSARNYNAALDNPNTDLQPLLSLDEDSLGQPIDNFPTTIAELEALPYQSPLKVWNILESLKIHPYPERFDATSETCAQDLCAELVTGNIRVPEVFDTAPKSVTFLNILTNQEGDLRTIMEPEGILLLDRLKRQLRVAVGLLPLAISIGAVNVPKINIV